ncbi:MAG: 1-(5-phosphoribosyl)-5-[Bacteroidales bacterium]|nr:1-(5-phosphoribosyl)-5-[(5-phosphoribosylamino)methylideneamino] imidazole-4-carboxamide isomerase [Bacteroidales bacterium]MBQ8462133.1 1-(5-phosphoribosyl)-5-[(5-phosphoribosylamino)methylideneamino] imidazole-4-carboxamide isomerase [Bacteroidales bacterium]MBQ9584211.1 1-(5-phosphoribosyl)-5-[(5-phosphoribosylamino)methylideneamino] imidazole-4-carboxamide isomerase [Bacteroidales bacterium]
MIEIIPAIDIIEGKCTRLSQGDYATQKNYGGDPAEWARAFAGCGIRRLHLVDLEGAKASTPQNLRTLEKIAGLGLLKLEWGGGIKDDDALASVWNAGADWAIIGSIAAKEPGCMQGWLQTYGSRIILGADIRNGKVAVSGWLEDSGIGLDSLIESFKGLEQAIVTDISRDGMLQGPAFDLYKGLQTRFPALKTIVSGGVSSMDDIRRADSMGLPGIIVGKAIYENRITLNDISLCLQKGSFPA